MSNDAATADVSIDIAEILERNLSFEVAHHAGVGDLRLETFKKFELWVSFQKVSHQLERVEQ